MSNIKQDLLDIIQQTMIPEVEAYLEDLHALIEKGEQTEDTMEETREMESFLVELQNIVLAVNENEINDEQAQEIYERIMALIEEHKDEH